MNIEALKKQIEERIAELEKEMQTFVENANRQISAFQGAIVENKRLLEALDKPDDE